MRKNIYPSLFGRSCKFGFIWNTDWLELNLVDCLFPTDAFTTDPPISDPFGDCTINPYLKGNFDYCKFAEHQKMEKHLIDVV